MNATTEQLSKAKKKNLQKKIIFFYLFNNKAENEH